MKGRQSQPAQKGEQQKGKGSSLESGKGQGQGKGQGEGFNYRKKGRFAGDCKAAKGKGKQVHGLLRRLLVELAAQLVAQAGELGTGLAAQAGCRVGCTVLVYRVVLDFIFIFAVCTGSLSRANLESCKP